MQAAALVRDRTHTAMGGNGPRALESYRRQLADVAAREGADHVEGHCAALIAKLMARPDLPPLVAPESTRRMQAVYARSGHPANEVRNHDFKVGCMINAWNHRQPRYRLDGAGLRVLQPGHRRHGGRTGSGRVPGVRAIQPGRAAPAVERHRQKLAACAR